MKLISMKQTGHDYDGIGTEPYPYGLSVRLGKKSLNALSIKADQVVVGDLVEFSAAGTITSISATPDGKLTEITIQITKMSKPQVTADEKSILSGHPASGHRIR